MPERDARSVWLTQCVEGVTHFGGRWCAEIMWPFSLPLPHMQPCSICEGWPSASVFLCMQTAAASDFEYLTCAPMLMTAIAHGWFFPMGILPLDLCSQLPWPWPVQPATLTLTYAASPLDHILYLIFLPHLLALFMTSLVQTAGYRMAAFMVSFFFFFFFLTFKCLFLTDQMRNQAKTCSVYFS